MAFEVKFDGKDDFDNSDREKYIDQVGHYLCVLKDTRTDNDSGAEVLEFEVQAGPFIGCKINKFLNDPALQPDDKKAESATKIYKAWAKRMGAITEAEALAGGQPDFIRLIGNRYVLDTELGQVNPKGKQYVNPKYLGVYPIDHPKIPLQVRADLKLGPARELKPGETAAPAAGTAAAGTRAAGKVAGHPPAGAPGGPAGQAAAGQVDVSDL